MVGQEPKRNLVVVGAGIGGLSTAFDAKHSLDRDCEVTVVSDVPNFSFIPSNPWVAVGKRKPEDVQLKLENILPKHKVNFVHSKATKLDPEGKKLFLDNGDVLNYDALVIATGPRLAFDIVPGLKEHGVSICTTSHAVHACAVMEKLIENPGPVVVGATQGASCFGPAYEYVMLLRYELKRKGGKELLDVCPIHFLTAEPYIGHLGLGGAADSEEVLGKLLSHRDIKTYTNARLVRVNKDSVEMEQVDDNGKVIHNETIPSKLTMFVPPFEGQDVWRNVPNLTDQKGLIYTNEYMQSPAYPEIFGVGVCVHLEKYEDTPVPLGVPKTGYMIESMGTAAVHNIKRMFAGDEVLKDKPSLNGLCITDFGDEGAIFLAMPQIPPRKREFTVVGKIGTLAKLAFEKYFLHKIELGNADPYYEKYALMLIGVERTTTERKKPLQD